MNKEVEPWRKVRMLGRILGMVLAIVTVGSVVGGGLPLGQGAVFLEESEGVFSVAGGFQRESSISTNNVLSGSMLVSGFVTRSVRLRQTSKGGEK